MRPAREGAHGGRLGYGQIGNARPLALVEITLLPPAARRAQPGG